MVSHTHQYKANKYSIFRRHTQKKSVFLNDRTFKCEVQKYHKELKKTREGGRKFNFSLGLRFNLY